MYTIEKKFTLAMGHRLSKHLGRCFSVHGHNLTILVALSSSVLDKNDMVMDFSDVKLIVSSILDKFDHCLLLNEVDEKLQEATLGMRVMTFMHDPTVERLSELLYTEIAAALSQQHIPGVWIEYVTIFENENSKCTFRL